MKDDLNNKVFTWYESNVDGIQADVFITPDSSWSVTFDKGALKVDTHLWLNDLMQGWLRQANPDRTRELNTLMSADPEIMKLLKIKFGYILEL